MQWRMQIGYGLAFFAIVGSLSVGAQPAVSAEPAHHVLLIPRRLEDAVSPQVVRAVAQAAVDGRLPLSLVPLKDIDMMLAQAVVYPAEWRAGDLREMCRLVQASRHVAVVAVASAPDSFRLVIGGAGCGPPVDSTTLPRTMSPRSVATHLLRLLERLP